ncbi:MAG: hypothetical protein GY778_29520, partial [bacterium]|nr:hypothetical protein [bacterium]
VFTAGEGVVLFLRNDGDVYRLVGAAQGKFTVTDGIVDRTGEPLADFVERVLDILSP